MRTINEVMRSKVENLELSVRSTNCMKNAGIKTIEELTKFDFNKRKVRNFGKKSLEEIVDKLAAFDLSFGMDDKAWLAWGYVHISLIKSLSWEIVL